MGGGAQRLKELSQLPHGAGILPCWGWKLSSPYRSGLGALTSSPRSHLPVSNTQSSFSSSPRSGRQPPTRVAFGPAEGVWPWEQCVSAARSPHFSWGGPAWKRSLPTIRKTWNPPCHRGSQPGGLSIKPSTAVLQAHTTLRGLPRLWGILRVIPGIFLNLPHATPSVWKVCPSPWLLRRFLSQGPRPMPHSASRLLWKLQWCWVSPSSTHVCTSYVFLLHLLILFCQKNS